MKCACQKSVNQPQKENGNNGKNNICRCGDACKCKTDKEQEK